MIDSIEIKNIQSHKQTKLEFCKGINVIVGSSNNGKSAILRALYWSIYNRPLGTDKLCSHWALDDKGNQTEDMEVIVTKGDNTLVRRKGRNVNQYIINGEELNAIKTDVPAEVDNFYKLTETNVQKQLSSPFLISASNGEVAKYFNGIARLDVIDKVLSYTEQLRRKQNNSVSDLEKRIENKEKEHQSFAWLEGTKVLLEKIERLENKEEKNRPVLSYLEKTKCSYLDYTNKLKYCNKLKKYITKINDIESYTVAINEDNKEINKLKSDITNYKNYKNKQLLNEKLRNTYDLISEIDLLTTEINKHEKEITNLIESKERYKLYLNTIKVSNSKKEKLIVQLPKICPLCGKPMEECTE